MVSAEVHVGVEAAGAEGAEVLAAASVPEKKIVTLNEVPALLTIFHEKRCRFVLASFWRGFSEASTRIRQIQIQSQTQLESHFDFEFESDFDVRLFCLFCFEA